MRGGPTLYKFSQPVQGLGKFVGHLCEAKAKMRGGIPTIPGGEQDALFRSRLAKGAAVLFANEPGESRHSATRSNPAQRLAMLGHEGGNLPKISSCGFLRSPEDYIAVAHGDLCQHFSGSIVGDGKNRARIPVALAALGIVLDHPTGPHSG